MTVENLNINVKTNADSAAEKIRSLSSALDKVQGAAKNAGGSSSKVADSVKEIGKAAKKSTSPLNTLLSSIKRIAFYRMIRSAIKAVTEALQEGVENVYRYSKAVGGEIGAAYDRIAGATSQMKNQLGAAWATLVTAIEPILVRFINLITLIIEKITQLFAALSGKSTYLKATNIATEWAESTEKGAKAAKEWRNQILGFDEINRLEAPSNGSGSDNGPDYGAMFKEVQLEPWAMNLKKLFDDLRNTIVLMNGDLGMLAGQLETVGISAAGAYAATAKLFPKPKNGNIQPVLTQVIGNLNATQTAFNNLVVASNLSFAQMELSANAWKQSMQEQFASAKQSVNNNLEVISQKMKTFSSAVIVIATALSVTLSATWAKVTTGIQSAFSAIQTFAATFLNQLKSTVSNALESIWQTVSGWAMRLWEKLTSLGQTIGNIVSNKWNSYLDQRRYNMENGVMYEPQGIFGGSAGATGILAGLSSLASTLSSIPVFASGGFPDAGLFVAGEAGPELIGTMGGRTAVANNDMIVDGIRAGVYEAMTAAMANGNNSTPIPVEIDGRRIAEILYPYNKQVDARHGVSLINA